MDENKSKRLQYLDKRAKDKIERNIEDIRDLAKTPQGRRFLWKILTLSGIHNTGFVENVNLMYYLAGKRDIGGVLLDEIKTADPNLFAKMQAEYYSEVKSEEAQAERYFKQDQEDGTDGSPEY